MRREYLAGGGPSIVEMLNRAETGVPKRASPEAALENKEQNGRLQENNPCVLFLRLLFSDGQTGRGQGKCAGSLFRYGA